MDVGKAIILVVEDDMLVRMGAVDIVLCCGYGAVDASDAAEAIRTLESRTDIDLVFTDVQMPGRMDGIQLSHYICDRWPTVKLLVTSGATDVLGRDREELFAAPSLRLVGIDPRVHRYRSSRPDDTGLRSRLKITLMSWTGVLPEADFYCPLPYQPLEIMTEEAVAACASQDRPLDAVFEVIRLQLTLSDPDYARRIGLPDLTVDSFAGAYFAERERQDPFRWARKNLEEVECNKRSKTTVPWRYALLRMHEKLEAIVTRPGSRT